MKEQNAKTIARVERERESYNLENEKNIFILREKYNQKSNSKYFTTNRGITIIVLIITIIVMLILLGIGTKVAIDGKLFDTARTAVDTTNNKVALQESRVNELADELDNVIQSQCKHEWGEEKIVKAATCSENGEKVRSCVKCGKIEAILIAKLPHNFENGTCSNCKHNLVIGANISGYDPSIGEDGKMIATSYTSPAEKTGHTKDQIFTVTSIKEWRVLAEIDGQILITTDKYIAADNETRYALKGKKGYVNGIDELNNVCSIYGQGKYADKSKYTLDIGNKISTGSRSITQADGSKNGEKLVISTESAVFYKNPETGYITVNGQTTTERQVSVFNYYDEETNTWKTLENGESVTIHKRYKERISSSEVPVDLWFSEGTVYSKRYYTADQYIWFQGEERGTGYGNGYGIMTNQMFSADGGGGHMTIYSFYGEEGYGAFQTKVRPVVYLQKNTVLEYDETNNLYTIIN